SGELIDVQVVTEMLLDLVDEAVEDLDHGRPLHFPLSSVQGPAARLLRFASVGSDQDTRCSRAQTRWGTPITRIRGGTGTRLHVEPEPPPVPPPRNLPSRRAVGVGRLPPPPNGLRASQLTTLRSSALPLRLLRRIDGSSPDARR